MTVRRFTATIPPLVLQGLTATATSSTSVTVSWTAYPGATAYQVRRNGTLIATPTGTTYTNSGHTASTAYTYAVRPVVGGVGVASAEASVNVTTPGGVEYAGLTPTVIVSTASALQTALASATAGAIIGVEPGVYTGTNTASRFTPAFRTTNSGISGNPIRIVARYPASTNVGGAVSELRCGSTTAGAGCPAFGSSGQNYVEWIGFYVSEANSATRTDTGPVVMVNTTGSAIRRCNIAGLNTYAPADNHPGIRCEAHFGCTISDNIISGFYCSVVNATNGCGIETYTGGNLTIENNLIFDCGSGVLLKADGTQASGNTDPSRRGWFIVRRNYIRDCTRAGIINARNYPGGHYRDFYQNVMSNPGEWGIVMWNYAPDDPRLGRFQNNTIYSSSGSSIGVYLRGPMLDGNQFWNNAVYTARSYYSESVSDAQVAQQYWDAERNCYFWTGSFSQFLGSGAKTLTQWKALGQDADAINANPLFVDVTGGNFRLQAGSPCLTLGRDLLSLTGTADAVVPCGAYITGTETIGVRA